MLRSVHERSQRSLEAMTAEGRDLAAEIASAVVGLQLQDRMNQRIHHVIEALARMEKTAGSSGRHLLDEVRRGYTMDAERAALARTLEGAGERQGGSDVELF